jgi:hypothetical protein
VTVCLLDRRFTVQFSSSLAAAAALTVFCT